MSAMAMEFAMSQARKLSTEFAGITGLKDNEKEWIARYNGFYAGYVRCIGERESLRSIVFKMEGTKVSKDTADKGIDDLI